MALKDRAAPRRPNSKTPTIAFQIEESLLAVLLIANSGPCRNVLIANLPHLKDH
jgi:hypothetical protein